MAWTGCARVMSGSTAAMFARRPSFAAAKSSASRTSAGTSSAGPSTGRRARSRCGCSPARRSPSTRSSSRGAFRARRRCAMRPGRIQSDGAPPGPVEFLEGEVRLVADPLEGQKTGAFLDQAENRIEAGRYAHGRALDCFTYGGAFALQLARRAERVLAVDISEDAAALGRE